MSSQAIKRISLVALLAVFCFGSIDLSTAEAGGIRWFRGRSFNSSHRSTTNHTYRRTYRTTTPVYRNVTPRSTTSNGRTQWPGAIGTPSPNYRFFQDVNGYWN